jgi:hypothetical protein
LPFRDLFQNQELMSYFPRNMADGSVYKFQTARNFSRRYENLADFSVLRPNDKKQFDEAYRLSGQFLKKWVTAGGLISAFEATSAILFSVEVTVRWSGRVPEAMTAAGSAGSPRSSETTSASTSNRL